MQRRHLLLASPMVLGACVPEGQPQTGNAPSAPPRAGAFDWQAALAEARRAAALLLDPDQAWALLPPAVREAAARAFAPAEGLGFSPSNGDGTDPRERFLPDGGLVYVSKEQYRLAWEERARLIAAGIRRPGDSNWGWEGLVGTDFHIGPTSLGFDLLRVELDTNLIGPPSEGLRPYGDADRRGLLAHVTTAIDRVEGRLDLARIGSSLVLASRRQPFSRATLAPAGPETRRIDRWQVIETVEESVLWREVLDDPRRGMMLAPYEPDRVRTTPSAHLRGPHLRISQETDGQAAVTALHSRLLGIGRARMERRNGRMYYALNEAGRERLQAALAQEARLYAEAPLRARQVPEANRARARGVFQSAFGLWQAGNYAAARRGFEEGLQIDPWNGAAHFYLHEIYRNRVDTSRFPVPFEAEQAKALLVGRHLRLAAALLPPDSREGIEARTMLSAT